MKKFTAFAFLVMLTASSSLAFAQTATSGSFFSRMPMFSFWGTQATATVPSTQTTLAPQFGQFGQTGQANASASLQDFWSLMPMFQLLNISQ